MKDEFFFGVRIIKNNVWRKLNDIDKYVGQYYIDEIVTRLLEGEMV